MQESCHCQVPQLWLRLGVFVVLFAVYNCVCMYTTIFAFVYVYVCERRCIDNSRICLSQQEVHSVQLTFASLHGRFSYLPSLQTHSSISSIYSELVPLARVRCKQGIWSSRCTISMTASCAAALLHSSWAVPSPCDPTPYWIRRNDISRDKISEGNMKSTVPYIKIPHSKRVNFLMWMLKIQIQGLGTHMCI